MSSPTEITVSQLSRLIGTPACPALIDVRINEDVEAHPTLLPGAICYPFADVAALAPHLHGKNAVVYCHKGKKLSQGAAAILRDRGIATETLEGGHVAWAESGEIQIPIEKIPPRNADGRTVWVTRHRPKIDRLACPWLIRRFIDPSAQFLFVAPSEVTDVAERFNATPFDIENTVWGHRGEKCTFDTMIDEFSLKSDALFRLAVIVRGADTNRHDLAPEAAGLLAASLGLSRMFRNDLEQLDAAMLLYDAFYRWSRDASEETHDWPVTEKETNK